MCVALLCIINLSFELALSLSLSSPFSSSVLDLLYYHIILALTDRLNMHTMQHNGET